MKSSYIVRAKKLITVNELGTINDGAMVIKENKIKDIGEWEFIKESYNLLEVLDYSNYVICPSFVDCHTHVLEYAPGSLYPVTEKTHLMGGTALLLHALSSGVTALGEQVCGHPQCNLTLADYKNLISKLPIHVYFSLNSISIGFDPLVHFTSITGSKPVNIEKLTDNLIIDEMAKYSEYPGENVFINATPANFTEDKVPLAGEVIYTQEELNKISETFHAKGKKLGVHVAGEKGIEMTLKAGVDIIHHAHGITEELIDVAYESNAMIVATPLGGTHLPPNTPEEIVKLVLRGLIVAISTDCYLPPSSKAPWLSLDSNKLYGPEILMTLASPAMKQLNDIGLDENRMLALITLNGAKVLGKEHLFGSLKPNMEANFIVSTGIPGLEIIDTNEIKQVYFKGEKVISR